MGCRIDVVCSRLRRAGAFAQINPGIKPVRGNLTSLQDPSMMIDVPIRGISPKLKERMRMRGFGAAPKTRRKEKEA